MRWFEKPLVSQCSESRDARESIKEPLEKALEWGPREELTGLKLTADGPLLKPLLPLSIHTNALHCKDSSIDAKKSKISLKGHH